MGAWKNSLRENRETEGRVDGRGEDLAGKWYTKLGAVKIFWRIMNCWLRSDVDSEVSETEECDELED
ncbi:hypothetical protein DUI87_03863 [Hirundo rustica rustica]|uniref:Uncharacterized protein n=1 Tax=Hirundo rustica rustica TaxID=333673 RepID=A0A3M0LJI9_HIRRU|nr:hypothetical protein DUI87_03863 [Hirundo rustica rustica]